MRQILIVLTLGHSVGIGVIHQTVKKFAKFVVTNARNMNLENQLNAWLKDAIVKSL